MSSQMLIARGAADCQHPMDEPLVWKFNGGNPCYLCPRCRVTVGYDPMGSNSMTLRQLRSLNRAVV